MPESDHRKLPEQDQSVRQSPCPNPDRGTPEGGEHRESQALAGESLAIGLEIHPQVRQSQEAFRRALPQLLQRKELYGHWVAYRGDEQIGTAKAEDDLYRECARRGLQEHEYVVRCIVPETPDEVDGTPLYPV
jgi:hypothetical protein